jgi:CheY-like chemotaxis protein
MKPLPLWRQQTAPTILVLDDDDALRGATVRVLSRSGYRVLMAASAVEALQIAKEWVGSIDVLLCDLVLPGLSGWEAASALVARRPGMKVIFSSGSSTHGSFGRQLDRPGRRFLAKPFEVPELLGAVEAVLEGDAWPRLPDLAEPA